MTDMTTRSAGSAARDADFLDAERGFVATLAHAEIRDASGRVVWTLRDYGFLDDPTPASTVHPNLWRQARLNMAHGLFQVTERIYQVRGFDIANITFVEGERGVIVIDPLTCVETAAAALALYRRERGDRPVTALIYTHSHVDHFGGARGVLDEVAAIREGVPVFATRQPGDEQATLGDYYPVSSYQSKAQFEALGCPAQRG